MTKLKAPFHAFGGKSSIARLVWEKIGDVQNFIEPFANSASVLLARPHPPQVETLNDIDCYISNFWRATQHDPEGVVEHVDGPVNECDLHARHRHLVLSEDAVTFRQRMRTDPHHFDTKIAGWWCWGLCCWIGTGWCSEKMTADGDPAQKKPVLGGDNPGSVGKGIHANGDLGTCEQRRDWLLDWFGRLRDRLRLVRVCCGDWSRVCSSPSVTTRLGTTGVFLDPPYPTHQKGRKNSRAGNIYSSDSGQKKPEELRDEVLAWCLKHGSNSLVRIVVCGYEGDGYEVLAAEHGWEAVAWEAAGGYGNRSGKGKVNAKRERLWCSPYSLHDGPLFAGS